MKKDIYLDYAATTFVRQEVLDTMIPLMRQSFGNPSSIHNFGIEAKKAVEKARTKIAQVFGANSEDIYFTSGGTESDNLAIAGVAYANKNKGGHVITSKIEHPAVMNACKRLEKDGFKVDYLDVDEFGTVDINQLKEKLTNETILVSIMFANNEIGTIQPISKIGEIIKANSKAYFHVDAVQAAGTVDVDLKKLASIDLMSFSAHKFYGPKGMGGLFVRKGTKFSAVQLGGSQERKKRAGTENVPGIIGMAKALELAAAERTKENERLSKLRDGLIERVLKEMDYVRLNGHKESRLPNNANFSFGFIEGESLLLRMNQRGIAASTGSACSTASLEPSHVLLAIGLSHETAHGSYRITIGKNTIKEDLDYTVDALREVVSALRSMSPLYRSKEKG